MSFPTARPKATPAPSPRIRIVSTDRRYLGFHITNQEQGRKENDKRAALVKGGL
ncbi:hypothetical protein [Acidovorax sp. BL-A-41-H1]|uniref:hypothetical protein n=1 Tax=Acidovorax sp. BL-A-41-H1 TaxID=3421102 RepID=UPI003F79D084